MVKNPFIALFVLLTLAIILIPRNPVRAWEYQDGTPSDSKEENFGPRADKLIIKLHPTETAEFDALARGEIDITDYPLTKEYKDLFESNVVNPATGLPYKETTSIASSDNFGLYILDINNNNNQYLGNPPDPRYPNPCYPNPTSVKEMRQAIAYLTDRNQLNTIIGQGLYTPLYTPVPPSMGAHSHPEIQPEKALENLTYPYSRAAAATKLDEGHFPIGDSGWRYWDLPPYNPIGPRGPEDRDLEIKFFIRSDSFHRRDMGKFLLCELLSAGIRVKATGIWGSSGAARIQVMLNKDFHLYTGAWGLTADPDHLVLWNWNFYWHPGNCYNVAGINNADFNDYSYGVMSAGTIEEARENAWRAQEVFAENALSVPLWAYASNMAMSRFYTGGNAWTETWPDDGENAYRSKYWEGAVNMPGTGIRCYHSFLNMHPRGYERGSGSMTIRCGFKVNDIKTFNPIFAEWYWDWIVLDMQYDSLIRRSPYDLAEYMPWLAQAFELNTYLHPGLGKCTKIRFTLRPDATWQDGTPITMYDIYFTYIELNQILHKRGLPPPWWISEVSNIISFCILDPYNFEVLLDTKSVFALGWIGNTVIIPAHIWKPLAESGPVQDEAPDPNMILSGPYRLAEYVPYSYLSLVANKPGSTVQTSLPGSAPVTSPKGYFRYSPIIPMPTIDGNTMAKVSWGASHTIKSKTANLWYGGSTIIDLHDWILYPNGTRINLNFFDIILNASGQPNDAWSADILSEVLKGRYEYSSGVCVESPPELGCWLNSSSFIWATINEDIAGSTFYDNIGLPQYPYKSQMPSPDIQVDIKDVAIAGKAFGAYPGHSRWNTVADVNGDYKIDIKDIAAIAKKFGWVG